MRRRNLCSGAVEPRQEEDPENEVARPHQGSACRQRAHGPEPHEQRKERQLADRRERDEETVGTPRRRGPEIAEPEEQNEHADGREVERVLTLRESRDYPQGAGGWSKQSGADDMTAKFGPRLVEQERCAYLRPWVIHSQSPDANIANTEYMFPYVTVVQCPQEQMIEKIGPTLVASAITKDKKWERQLTDATNIDRLNIGPIPTTKLDWLQPHEGNIVDFLFRARAFQIPQERLVGRA